MAPQKKPQQHEVLPLPPLGHGPGGDRGHGVHEGHHVEEEAEDARATGRLPPVEGEAALPEEDPVTGLDQRIAEGSGVAEVVAREHVAEAAEHEGEADEEEGHEAQPEDGEVRADHVAGVLGPTEAGLHQGEAGLHEDDQDGAEDDPEQVDLLAQRRDGVGLLGARDGGQRQDGGDRDAEARRAACPGALLDRAFENEDGETCSVPFRDVQGRVRRRCLTCGLNLRRRCSGSVSRW